MKVNFSGSCRPQVNILDPGQVNAVLESSYEVLERTGVRVGLPEALSLLEASGASVSGDVVRIPQTLVKRALDSAPPAFDVYGRDGKRSVRIQNGRLYFGPGIDAPFAIDEYTGERRPFLRRDTRTAARLCDALPNMDVAVGMGTITDVPDEIASVYELADLLSWNRKPVIGWGTSLDNLRDMHRIASLVAGGEDKHRVRPLFAFFADPLSPLVHTGEVLKQMLYCADHMIPFLYVSAPLAGGTSPTSLAGTIVLVVSELLAGLTIHQLRKPGAPFAMGWVAGTMDMKCITSVGGGPEVSLLQMGLNDVLSTLRLPTVTSAGTTDSKCVDEQMAAELAISELAVSLSSPSLVLNAGLLECGLSASALMLLISDEVIGMIKRIVRGIDIDDERLAIADMESAGPGGNHLGSALTYKHYRTEYWYPTLMDRHTFGQWQEMGAKGLLGRARERLTQILSTYEVPPLPIETSRAINAVLGEAKARTKHNPV